MKNTLIKFFDFAVICVAILAAIGGTAYLFYYQQPLFAVVNILLVAMASPFIISRAKDLIQ